MRILWSIHLYPPKHNCGAENFARNINRELIKRGHEVKVLLHQANQYKIKEMYDYEDVMVFPPDPMIIDRLFTWADLVISHLDYNKWTTHTCEKYHKPMVHVTHNDIPYASVIDSPISLKVIYNAEWVKEKLNYKWDSIVFPPPIDEWVKTEDKGREYITLINLNDNKGANYFYSLAKKLPHFKFLGVRGSYDGQIIQNLPNVTILPNTPDIRKVYEISKVVLMPSHYESWGMVASEAMANGIPVIANPTPGLSENIGKGGILINRKETAKWAEEITKLMTDEKYYHKWSKAALKRAKEQVPDWDGLEQFLTSCGK